MSELTVLIIGKIGQVGWELRRTLAPLGRIVAVDYPEIDLRDGASLRKWVGGSRAQVVINAAAYTAVDKAEAEPEICEQINGVAPGIIAEEAKASGALLVHYSTDYIFDGTKPSSYVENDPPNPLGAYGRSKLAGDRAVQQINGPHLIFRLCWVYGARGQNFMRTIMRLAREREKLRVVTDQVGCPTWSRMIAQATAFAVQRTLAGHDRDAFNGVYHLAASGQASWHEFARAIVERMPATEKKCLEIEAIPTSEYPLPAKRPANSVLGCQKLARTFGIQLPHWEESLAEVFEA